MASVGNQKIRNDYSQYLQVVNGLKVAASPIALQKGATNNANWLGAQVAVQHESVSSPIQFSAEKHTKWPTNFKFKLFAPHLASEPVFRFDSDGAAHRNDLDCIPLSERQVTTPHFHKFNEDGINVAYKTEVLKSQANADAIVGDVNFGMAHFSTEAHLEDDDGKPPMLEESQIDLPMQTDHDPTAGVKFE